METTASAVEKDESAITSWVSPSRSPYRHEPWSKPLNGICTWCMSTTPASTYVCVPSCCCLPRVWLLCSCLHPTPLFAVCYFRWSFASFCPAGRFLSCWHLSLESLMRAPQRRWSLAWSSMKLGTRTFPLSCVSSLSLSLYLSLYQLCASLSTQDLQCRACLFGLFPPSPGSDMWFFENHMASGPWNSDDVCHGLLIDYNSEPGPRFRSDFQSKVRQASLCYNKTCRRKADHVAFVARIWGLTMIHPIWALYVASTSKWLLNVTSWDTTVCFVPMVIVPLRFMKRSTALWVPQRGCGLDWWDLSRLKLAFLFKESLENGENCLWSQVNYTNYTERILAAFIAFLLRTCVS